MALVNFVASVLLKFDRCKMLNGYGNFLFNILSLRMTVSSDEMLGN